jgi:predicted SAM-dependent methyltransferase
MMADFLGGQRWLEIGSGKHPTPGYVHCDIDPGAAHLEIHSDASGIPLGDGCVDRILCIHLVEHFSQYDIIKVLREWRRLLSVGGKIEIHTPDFTVVSQAFLNEKDISKKMEIAHTILGLHQHRSILDFHMLKCCMEAVGFKNITQIEGEDRHDEGWKHVIPGGWSMKVTGTK